MVLELTYMMNVTIVKFYIDDMIVNFTQTVEVYRQIYQHVICPIFRL